ncbi:MAG: bifunctional 3-demethylubiquinol 3-O-methyltransferase/2-polyprenyl-6-hydroxyphenol methylase [Oceanicaulis sp.]|jgi:2-polyprenyl-6-hydroxyphenyl methylase/3-demethylubiquinone-9 3-methyltransferase|uniref:bifunctional 2-polyprenyl-6-hydroxyphenol methylase/3-demethylubiquinol 3-O-methyltransferase UbiG n=1 Tax=Oceanicaulis sp. UBA6590 TaxID=1947008 RepID=UPI000C5BE7B0|nr:bifunctional 2-polyprenyl-6-hydroxyphenol methylase/3-demethylubiquinol 3-O-methyltransferase UbiG [Oceanicaulis sp. UBA6590]MAB70519.1 bifunctional 3-demethylubiquinol 3-O-methyltransferase/2-polyprenyl-6-hydroxyphenol methylase [Oceanicaulis sp.]MBG35988.1 bifunctional 3-demethylubiquinol 3-O-methyltransferase/2-polyprenyl-6-hydroxyphenol methylase [Oceanicaulis sp.]HBU62279.1 bifunctional 3-demethylubiquinol 3-O-methyltransferase/2-polyprenyl-6-hydroxyphenol methylase [Oceanicaulis sp.]|tara:strand:+ start:206 stop:976 length:771 start_codon:yes stop_codon:yes gene_type:complete
MAQAEAPTALSTPSIDPEEVEKFSRIAGEWWDPKSKFAPLHKFNPARLTYIRDILSRHFKTEGAEPLKGLKVLDIGCGGGLVSEPIARLGASVTGVDAAEANIKTALVHAEENGLSIDYRHGTAEQLLEDGGPEQFDVVLNLEVVEHVANPDQFLRDCARMVKPGGMMIVGSINRTPRAFATAIFGAEYVLGWLPRGTHRFSKLVKPMEVRAALKAEGLTVMEPVGVSYNPLKDVFFITSDSGVNYLMGSVKPATS